MAQENISRIIIKKKYLVGALLVLFILSVVLMSNLMPVVRQKATEKLWFAVQGSSVEEIGWLTRICADFNATNKHGLPPLWDALRFSDSEAVAFLIENGADVKFGGKYGTNFLW